MTATSNLGIYKVSWQARGEPWKDRVRWLVNHYADGSREKFADKRAGGVSGESVRKWMEDGVTPRMETLAVILHNCEGLSPEYLVLGTGPRRIEAGEPGTGVARDLMAELRDLYGELAQRYGDPPVVAPTSAERAEGAQSAELMQKDRAVPDPPQNAPSPRKASSSRPGDPRS